MNRRLFVVKIRRPVLAKESHQHQKHIESILYGECLQTSKKTI